MIRIHPIQIRTNCNPLIYNMEPDYAGLSTDELMRMCHPVTVSTMGAS